MRLQLKRVNGVSYNTAALKLCALTKHPTETRHAFPLLSPPLPLYHQLIQSHPARPFPSPHHLHTSFPPLSITITSPFFIQFLHFPSLFTICTSYSPSHYRFLYHHLHQSLSLTISPSLSALFPSFPSHLLCPSLTSPSINHISYSSSLSTSVSSSLPVTPITPQPASHIQ